MCTSTDAREIDIAETLFRDCEIHKSSTCSDRCPLQYAVSGNPGTHAKNLYHQTRKGGLCVHSDQTRKMLTIGALVERFHRKNPQTQVLLVGSDTFVDYLFDPEELKRFMALSDSTVRTTGSGSESCRG